MHEMLNEKWKIFWFRKLGSARPFYNHMKIRKVCMKLHLNLNFKFCYVKGEYVVTYTYLLLGNVIRKKLSTIIYNLMKITIAPSSHLNWILVLIGWNHIRKLWDSFAGIKFGTKTGIMQEKRDIKTCSI